MAGPLPSGSHRRWHLLRLQLQLDDEGDGVCKVGNNERTISSVQRLIEELKQKESKEERMKGLEVKKGKVGFDMGLKVFLYIHFFHSIKNVKCLYG